MLEKFLNKKVQIRYTIYGNFINAKGVLTNLDENFIELDNDEVIAIRYILSIKSL